MRVLSVTHGELVRSELFGEVVLGAGHELVEWEIGADPRPPGEFDAVLVLGGHMNVGEEAEHPWLEDEYALLRSLVATETPLFAVCLGAQTLAHAFGGRVEPLQISRRASRRSSLTPAGGERPRARGAPVPVRGARRQRVRLRGAERRGRARRLAGAASGVSDRRTAWAVQFHPEARRGQVLRWFESDEARLPRPLAGARARARGEDRGLAPPRPGALPGVPRRRGHSPTRSAAVVGRVVPDARCKREHDPRRGREVDLRRRLVGRLPAATASEPHVADGAGDLRDRFGRRPARVEPRDAHVAEPRCPGVGRHPARQEARTDRECSALVARRAWSSAAGGQVTRRRSWATGAGT